MNKRTQIMLFTAFSLVIGPLIILGFLFRILGDLLGILGWLCWMEPHMAIRDWNKLKDKIKQAWKN